MHILIAALHRPIKPTGVCRHAANLARCLADRSDVTQVSLVIGAWQHDYFKTAFAFNFAKIELIIVDVKNSSLSRNFWFLRGLPILANAYNPDIVHLSFPFPIFRRKFNAPVVSTIHDLYPYEYPENFGFPQVWFNRLFLQQCIGNSDGLTCVSQITLDKLKLYFPRLNSSQKVAVIYNYVDFERLKPQIPPEFAEDSLFLLSVAQHRQNKNLDLLIKAYVLLLNEQKLNPSTKLVIVGATGFETETIKHLISNFNLEQQVILLSAIADTELCWLYQHCQAFIIPSSTEGFCLPLVEALKFSDRVVCSDIPIFKEVGSHNCVYFSLNNNSIQNLAQAIMQSLNKSIKQSDTNSANFSKSQVGKQYFNFYSDLA